MAGLRDLLEYGSSAGGNINFDTIYVYNTSRYSVSNGGQCCLFSVPANVTWFGVEMWGGGGGGSGACCCFAGRPGGSGSYARKIVNGLSGDGSEEFTICAAGSTGCSNYFCIGCAGNPSFLRCNGGSVITCAAGGNAGCGHCFMHGTSCARMGFNSCQIGSACGTLCLPGIAGASRSMMQCTGGFHQYMPSAPFTPGGMRGTKDACSGVCHGCTQGGCAQWPGGGGASAVSHTSTQYCGASGAGGLVIIYYPVVTTE